MIAIEPERSRALHASLAAGEAVTVEPKSIADGLNGPYAGRQLRGTVCLALGVESVLVTEEEHRGRVPVPLRAREARRARAPAPPRRPRSWPGKCRSSGARTVAAVVSGGNVAPETASAILARR